MLTAMSILLYWISSISGSPRRYEPQQTCGRHKAAPTKAKTKAKAKGKDKSKDKVKSKDKARARSNANAKANQAERVAVRRTFANRGRGKHGLVANRSQKRFRTIGHGANLNAR
ncbi:MAG: hypothetical protein ACYDD2_11215 [Candidatus Acidiferrales bacterium]